MEYEYELIRGEAEHREGVKLFKGALIQGV